MPLYVIERNLTERFDLVALDRAGIGDINDDVGIRWIDSFVSADGRKSYCLYEAPHPEAIREGAARVGLPADLVVPVVRIAP